VAAAVTTVVPGVNVLEKLATAYVSPVLIVSVASTEPISVLDEDKLIAVSFVALAGKPSASCSCTKMQADVALSEGTDGGLMTRFRFVGWLIVSEETCPMNTAEKITRVIVSAVNNFLVIASFLFV
jgi:hypothetical protein